VPTIQESIPAATTAVRTEECAPEDVRARRIRRTALALAPGVLYLAVREFGVLVLWLTGRVADLDLVTTLTTWDGQWYLGLAAGGYANAPADLLDAYGAQSAETPLAFFPGYPTVVRWVGQVPGLTLVDSALLVSTVFGILAAYALVRLGRIVRGGSDRAGYVLVALFAASPMGVVLSMAYSESMFCALAAWTLVFLLERRWLWAGACCALAGLVRPTAAALVLAVAVAALVYVYRARGNVRTRTCAIVGVLVAPTGLLGYLSWAGDWIRPQADWLDRMASWTELQENGWGSHFDGGIATLGFVRDTLSEPNWQDGAAIAVVAGAVPLLVWAFRRRLEWPLLAYTAGMLVMTLGSAGLMTSKPRLLLPAFTLLVPPAMALAKRRTATLAVVLACVVVASAWFGACSLVFWENAI